MQATGCSAFGGYLAIGALGYGGMEGPGKIGDALGPGYRDLLQGVAGMGLIVASPKLAGEAKVVGDRTRITSLSNAGKIDEARAILQPHVDAGDANAIVRRLDVSSPRDRGYLWSGNKDAAGAYAADHGGVTLEQTPGGRVIDNWDGLQSKMPWDKGGKEVWGGTSQKYAEGMSGDVTAVQSPEKAGGGYIYKTYEQPAIKDGLRTGRITNFDEKVVLPNESKGP
ncbi:hypothetical protein KZX46_16750 [Polymorphobacter sp. PAMC 29334]|uniref:hypothetical protein n=1 Tax=Polymorphobacter sp. PAMC 29334 TaxID=2862331 RepID=UPI001C771483|nr:hypothetical protein [Polymorphobacter sp. PAMC 29334]QYE34409.1 hypothetical protein KZX46_16750 [Polymorphobacter sp. PAMC 29334]